MPTNYSMALFFATVETAIMGRKTLDIAPPDGRRLSRRLVLASNKRFRPKPKQKS
jgi:hypothetical protein